MLARLSRSFSTVNLPQIRVASIQQLGQRLVNAKAAGSGLDAKDEDGEPLALTITDKALQRIAHLSAKHS